MHTEIYRHSCVYRAHMYSCVVSVGCYCHCAAKAFYSCPAIISRRPESQKTPKEPQ